jgi:pyridoxamine 5'-phosphate oxidase
MDLDASADPLALFDAWLADAAGSEPNDPNAMALATADAEGRPSVRMVLLKGRSPDGFVFFTNLESRKGGQLAANPAAALCFHWKTLRRQVRIEGPVERVGDAEADAYYASRPRGSRIGAWASRQSRPLASREELERAVAETEARFPGDDIPRPPFWSGFRVVPRRMEFWAERPFRLHDRIVFARAGSGWAAERQYP